MMDSTDMSTPVTRGELREELAQLEIRLVQRMEGIEQRLLVELPRHIKAVSEDMARQISVIDDKYADLPARVRRLETEVFPPRRR